MSNLVDLITRVRALRATATPGALATWVNPDGGFEIRAADGAVVASRSPWDHRADESRANGRLLGLAFEMADALIALADEIEAERAEVERLTRERDEAHRALCEAMAALEPFARPGTSYQNDGGRAYVSVSNLRRARAVYYTHLQGEAVADRGEPENGWVTR